MDHYKTLGVGRDATAEEIRLAYRKLARKYHPDANRTDEDAVDNFKKVAGAYEVLNDPEKKSQYDRFGFVDRNSGPKRSPFTSPLNDFLVIFLAVTILLRMIFFKKGEKISMSILNLS